MIPLLLAAASAGLFRLIGRFGVGPWRGWRVAVRHGLGVTFVLTGLAHFGPLRDDLARLLPAGVPAPGLLVGLAGALQVLGGLGLFARATTTAAGWLLVAIELAKLPANLNAARLGLTVANGLPTPPALRAPLVFLWIGLIVWAMRQPRAADGASVAASTPPSRT